MQPTLYELKHQGHTISSTPEPGPNGTYVVKVVITHSVTGQTFIVPLESGPGTHATAAAAATAGVEHGKAYLDLNPGWAGT